MWNHLKRVYHQADDARRFRLEHAIVIFQHDTFSNQDYYLTFFLFFGMNILIWLQWMFLLPLFHENSRHVQFLMKLHP